MAYATNEECSIRSANVISSDVGDGVTAESASVPPSVAASSFAGSMGRFFSSLSGYISRNRSGRNTRPTRTKTTMLATVKMVCPVEIVEFNTPLASRKLSSPDELRTSGIDPARPPCHTTNPEYAPATMMGKSMVRISSAIFRAKMAPTTRPRPQ